MLFEMVNTQHQQPLGLVTSIFECNVLLDGMCSNLNPMVTLSEK